LIKAEVADFRRIMDGCAWEDGRSTAGAQSALLKSNEQLPPDGEVARQLGKRVLSALTPIRGFISAAIRCRSFRRCSIAMRRRTAPFRHPCRQRGEGDRLTGLRIRTEPVVTLFCRAGRVLTAASSCRGLLRFPRNQVRPAISCFTRLQPAYGHAITEVCGVASFLWLQSMIRDAHARSLIFDLDTAIQACRAFGPR